MGNAGDGKPTGGGTPQGTSSSVAPSASSGGSGGDAKGGGGDGTKGGLDAPSGTCVYAISNLIGHHPAVPDAAVGPVFRCGVLAAFNITENTSLLSIKDLSATNPTTIPNTNTNITWALSTPINLLGSDFGTAPNIVLKSGASNTHVEILGLIFSDVVARPPVSQGFGNDWINPAVDPVHGPVQQGDWTISLSSLVTAYDDFVSPLNGDKLRLYKASGRGTFDMVWYKVDEPTTKASLTVTVAFTDALMLN